MRGLHAHPSHILLILTCLTYPFPSIIVIIHKIEPMDKVRANELYDVYKEWCLRNGHNPLNSTNFGLRIVKRFPRGRDGKGNIYKGVKLLSNYSSGIDYSVD